MGLFSPFVSGVYMWSKSYDQNNSAKIVIFEIVTVTPNKNSITQSNISYNVVLLSRYFSMQYRNAITPLMRLD